jgi:hypothetical protein
MGTVPGAFDRTATRRGAYRVTFDPGLKMTAVSKQLTEARDAQTIANYSDPAFVPGGWTPVVDQ